MMTIPPHPATCRACLDGTAWDFPIAMAFQPIVDVRSRSIYAQEALVRGPAGESAGSVLDRVAPESLYRFDQTCRATAIAEAARLDLKTRLHVNIMPNAVYNPETCIRVTLEAARAVELPHELLTFEIIEAEKITDIAHVKSIFEHYRSLGFLTALDDFGAGYAGLNLLADIQPHIVKLDMKLVRGIDGNRVKRAIVRGVASVCEELEILLIGEGVETVAESRCLLDYGITLQQGYFFARPSFREFATPVFPE